MREGEVAYPFPVCLGEGEIALNLSLVCENAWLDSPESSSFISEQGFGTTVFAPFCSNRRCCCREGVAGCARGAGGAGWGA